MIRLSRVIHIVVSNLAQSLGLHWDVYMVSLFFLTRLHLPVLHVGYAILTILLWGWWCYGFQEAKMKDTLEHAREPHLNLKGYLQNAYIHPIFKSDEEEEEEEMDEKWVYDGELVPTKRQSRRNTPLPSKYSGSSTPSLPEVVEERGQP